jgi:hypothetical protein
VTSFIDAPLPFSVVNDERLDFLRHDVRVVAGNDEQIMSIDRDEDRTESETFKNYETCNTVPESLLASIKVITITE